MGRSRDATRARYKKRNALERVGKGRKVLFCQTPVGVNFLSNHYIEPLGRHNRHR